jgi:hypothetical protein
MSRKKKRFLIIMLGARYKCKQKWENLLLVTDKWALPGTCKLTESQEKRALNVIGIFIELK